MIIMKKLIVLMIALFVGIMAEAQNIRQIESEQVALVQNIFAERARNPKHSGASIFTFDIKGGAAENGRFFPS